MYNIINDLRIHITIPVMVAVFAATIINYDSRLIIVYNDCIGRKCIKYYHSYKIDFFF